MTSGYKLFLLSLLPCCCLAQTDAAWENKAFYKDHLYLNRLLHDSHNPVSISETPADIADFQTRYSSEQGAYKPIDRGPYETLWTGRIYGIRKFDKLSFEGEIQYDNEQQADKKWSNALFISAGNPFFIADSLAGDYGTEKFTLAGGLSYAATPRWRIAVRATYHVGTLADQTDPRPLTQGMRLYLNPGFDYRISRTLTIGASAVAGRLSESTTYTVVNSIEPNVNTIFLFKGLGSPEIKTALGYRRRYEGNPYQGFIQLLWNASSLSNLVELGYLANAEEANDGDTGFDFKGGDYKATTYMLTDRLQLKTPAAIHNLTLHAERTHTDGLWYIQTQSTDPDGNTLWTIRDQSVTHRETALLASLSYRIDRMKGPHPHLTASLKTSYAYSGIRQYPDLYSRAYALLALDGHATKRFALGKSLLAISLEASYAAAPLQRIQLGGSRLEASYQEPAFRAISGSYYRYGADIACQTPLTLSAYSFLLNIHAGASVKAYNEAGLYSGATRQAFHAGLSLIF
jgi:hypothetical protein